MWMDQTPLASPPRWGQLLHCWLVGFSCTAVALSHGTAQQPTTPAVGLCQRSGTDDTCCMLYASSPDVQLPKARVAAHAQGQQQLPPGGQLKSHNSVMQSNSRQLAALGRCPCRSLHQWWHGSYKHMLCCAVCKPSAHTTCISDITRRRGPAECVGLAVLTSLWHLC